MTGDLRAGAARFDEADYSVDGRVYFVRVGERVKIGFSTRIPRRFVELSRGEGVPVTVLACVPGTTRLERELHEWFAPWSACGGRGDWFHATPELVSFADSIGGRFVGQAFAPEPLGEGCGLESRWLRDFRAFVEARGLTQKQVAAELGTCASKVHYWLHRGSVPRGRMRAQIESWSDGAVSAHTIVEQKEVS